MFEIVQNIGQACVGVFMADGVVSVIRPGRASNHYEGGSFTSSSSLFKNP